MRQGGKKAAVFNADARLALGTESTISNCPENKGRSPCSFFSLLRIIISHIHSGGGWLRQKSGRGALQIFRMINSKISALCKVLSVRNHRVWVCTPFPDAVSGPTLGSIWRRRRHGAQGPTSSNTALAFKLYQF